MKKKKRKQDDEKEPEERWAPVQVAAFMGLSYQTARNQMLAGAYGRSEYDAKKRLLTVRRSRVEKVKRSLIKTDAE